MHRKQILAVCDPEAEYTSRFCDYISKKESCPFEMAAFTSRETLERFCREEEVTVALIAEKMYDSVLEERIKGTLLILSEEKDGEDEKKIWKYQPCEEIFRSMMRCLEGNGEDVLQKKKRPGRMHLIGLFTPVHRCMQTGFALTLGEVLAREHKTLYLNFESFSGLSRRLDREFMTDMSDLIYYITNAREALFYKLKGMTETIRHLDYIPPVFSCMDLARITVKQWFLMLEELEQYTEYEYLILDLSEQIQGLFDILRSCEKIFTLTRGDHAASAKLSQYEKLLERAEYEDVLEKTCKYRLPFIRNVSLDPEMLTHGELAEHVKKLVKENLYDS